jgi:hypothetical protein
VNRGNRWSFDSIFDSSAAVAIVIAYLPILEKSLNSPSAIRKRRKPSTGAGETTVPKLIPCNSKVNTCPDFANFLSALLKSGRRRGHKSTSGKTRKVMSEADFSDSSY